jgi:hypothetical protein
MRINIENKKYRANTFNIAGFALMTPLGAIFIDFVRLCKDIGPVWFIIQFVISFGLFIAGLTCLEIGRNIMTIGIDDESNKRRL